MTALSVNAEEKYGDSTTWKWNLFTKRYVENASIKGSPVLGISPSGILMATGGASGEVKIHNLVNPAMSRQLIPNDCIKKITRVIFIQENILLSCDQDNNIRVWSLENFQEIFQINDSETSIKHFAISSCRTKICFSSKNGTIKVWNIRNRKQIITVVPKKNPSIENISFREKDKNINISCSNGSMILLDLFSRKLRKSFYIKNRINVSTFSKDGSLLAFSNEANCIVIVDIETSEILAILVGHTKRVTALAFSNDNRLLASGSHDGAILIWDVQKRNIARNLLRSRREIIFLKFSLDDRLLISTDYGSNIEFWWCTRTLENSHNPIDKPTTVRRSNYRHYRSIFYGIALISLMLYKGILYGFLSWLLVMTLIIIFSALSDKYGTKSKIPSEPESTKYSEVIKSVGLILEKYNCELTQTHTFPDYNEGSPYSSLKLEENRKLAEKAEREKEMLIQEQEREKKAQEKREKREAIGSIGKIIGSALISGLLGVAIDEASSGFGSMFGLEKVRSHVKPSSGKQVDSYWRRKPNR